jgi:hypothetical protein
MPGTYATILLLKLSHLITVISDSSESSGADPGSFITDPGSGSENFFILDPDPGYRILIPM